MQDTKRSVEPVLPAALAQELLHIAVLAHDDIIDRDHIRYGVKNINGQYDEKYKIYISDSGERLHFANSAAILAGDLLIAEAFSAIGRCQVDAALIAKAQTLLSETIFRVVGGELLDTESAFRTDRKTNSLMIAEQKTASYSLVSPLVMGAILAGASPDAIRGLADFGLALGIAYQLQDDLLGVFGDEAVTGKSTSGDIIEGKYTYLIEQFFRLADQNQKEQFGAVFKNQTTSPAEIAAAKELLIVSGAQSAVSAAIANYAETAKTKLDELSMNNETRAAFTALIDMCTVRVK
jgi:geranylgeranyl diphosphate synthase type II